MWVRLSPGTYCRTMEAVGLWLVSCPTSPTSPPVACPSINVRDNSTVAGYTRILWLWPERDSRRNKPAGSLEIIARDPTEFRPRRWQRPDTVQLAVPRGHRLKSFSSVLAMSPLRRARSPTRGMPNLSFTTTSSSMFWADLRVW